MTLPIPLFPRRARFRQVPGLAVAALLSLPILTSPGRAQEIGDTTRYLPPEIGSETPSFKPLPPPSLNFYGVPGVIDMPSGQTAPDGQFTTALAHFGGQTRVTLSFQATPWMGISFRYHGIQNWNMYGFETYYDRNFDVRFRLMQEARFRPEVTLGLQDFSGTGLFGAEYIAASKTLRTPAVWGSARDGGQLVVTGGIGWGRLGSYNNIGSFGHRPAYDGSTNFGGEPSYDQWFRGPYALFGGVEWRPNDRLGIKLEYSSDDYVTETQKTAVFEKKSPFNFGVEYQWTESSRLGLYYMYGSEIGASLQIQFNPRQPLTPMQQSAPLPIKPRRDWAGPPEAWTTDWVDSAEVRLSLRDRVAAELTKSGLVLESLELSGTEAELRYRNPRYTPAAAAVGRAARALAASLPPSVETFRLVPVANGMALSAVILRRSDLEALEYDGDAAQALRAVTAYADAPHGPGAGAMPGPDLYPDFSWSLAQYFAPSYFDPSLPFRLDLGVDLRLSYRPAPGWRIAGKIRQRVWGNVKDGRASNSVLPHVRTDQDKYAQHGTTIEELYAARYWRPGANLYARISGGYFESMFGGLSGELLWKPVGSRLALGIEANYAIQRDYDQLFSFRDYKVFTGHASAYYELGGGYKTQLDVGRYLAGDFGATFSFDRIFANGWSVGGFFTLTDVSSADFGEGSFDKGIRFRIPLNWMLGTPSRSGMGMLIRPVQRDGGQRLDVPGRLYDQVREAHRSGLDAGWERVWE
ncbi:YjbH domain-containing protein [Pseudodonghicola flavimaris]|uniref:YjbH domain-containing protein n=1 Tax=Pseudodonghicola flavimaris TaxID=3050036 RepID=A0ABT7F806_9RHOB|nr:YjbH domain-containing protein [Pseudodonghicola flavimaris]MDK3020756.1 YjbH domain-containing protein [Pseudodonghicola flavimaris]